MSEIRTKEEALREFNKGYHNWQTHRLVKIEDLSFVILNLLKKKFAVEINEHLYDLSFFKNEETGEVGYSWSSAPSPHLTSSEIIERAFREGTWYLIEGGNEGNECKKIKQS